MAINVMGDDWIRYTPNNWIVWTDRSATDWYTHLRRFISGDDQILIAEMNFMERSGTLASWIWVWIDKKLTGQNVVLNQLLLDMYPLAPTDIERAGGFGSNPLFGPFKKP